VAGGREDGLDGLGVQRGRAELLGSRIGIERCALRAVFRQRPAGVGSLEDPRSQRQLRGVGATVSTRAADALVMRRGDLAQRYERGRARERALRVSAIAASPSDSRHVATSASSAERCA
jgi:hypothetical protein